MLSAQRMCFAWVKKFTRFVVTSNPTHSVLTDVFGIITTKRFLFVWPVSSEMVNTARNHKLDTTGYVKLRKVWLVRGIKFVSEKFWCIQWGKFRDLRTNIFSLWDEFNSGARRATKLLNNGPVASSVYSLPSYQHCITLEQEITKCITENTLIRFFPRG